MAKIDCVLCYLGKRSGTSLSYLRNLLRVKEFRVAITLDEGWRGRKEKGIIGWRNCVIIETGWGLQVEGCGGDRRRLDGFLDRMLYGIIIKEKWQEVVTNAGDT
jgi:hypothetical protein